MVVALLSAPIGSGKTTAIQNLVRAAVTRGSKVVIAVPTLQLALEWTRNLSDLKVHNLASFANFFKMFEKFKCPKEAEITRDLDCAETQNNIRRRYCKSCPFVGKCGYANQYNEQKLREADVVIMQHAHLTSRKTREAISNLHADMLVIDEDCLESVLEHVEFPSNLVNEIRGLIDSGFPELEPLLEWQRKLGRPSGELKISRKQLLLLRDHLFNEGHADTLAQLMQLKSCYEENEELTTA